MTEVDFYILNGQETGERLQFACRLTDKAYKLGHRIYIHTESPQQTRLLDELLWTFQQNSFIPHRVFAADGDNRTPVQIGHDSEPDASHEVLINLAGDVPLFFSRFERVAELVNAEESVRRQGRQRYSFYKERGYALRTHEIKR